MHIRAPYRLFVLILLPIFLLFPLSLLAGNTGLSIQPIKVSTTVNPGETVEDLIRIQNPTDQRLIISALVEDFVPSAGSAQYSFVGRAEGVTTVRDWFSLDSGETFVVEPGERKLIRYAIEAPDDAEPGGHYGVVFFTAREQDPTGTLRVGARVGTLFFVEVPGNRLQSGKILDFSAPLFVQGASVTFVINFENTGTVHFEPRGTIVVKNMFGKVVGEAPIQGQVVLPTGARDLTTKLDVNGLLLGRYVAQANIVDGEGNELTADKVTFYAFPLSYVIGFIVSVLTIFFIIRFIRRNVSITIGKK